MPTVEIGRDAQHAAILVTYDSEYSCRSFTALEASQIPNDTTIYASRFEQETPDSQIFRSDMRGVTFAQCNLNNVIVPEGNTIIQCSQLRFKAQNDHNDWLIDDDNKPTRPIDHKQYTKRGLPMPDPKDIPASKTAERIDLRAQAEAKN